jgi:hypothetical protein
MKKIHSLLLFTTLIVLLNSCSKEDDPYIIFANINSNVITTEALSVTTGGNYELNVTIGFDKEKGEDNRIFYEYKIDEEAVQHFDDTGMLEVLTEERHNNLTIVNAKISLSFDENIISSGSQMKITVRDRWVLRKSLIFNVK